MSDKKSEYNAAAYAWIIPHLQTVCRENGYAIGIHGSMHRDLDLIAMPWTEEAVSDVALIESIRQAVQGTVLPDGAESGRWSKEENCFVKSIVKMPDVRAHGRICWNVHLTGGLTLDISVMPRDPTIVKKLQRKAAFVALGENAQSDSDLDCRTSNFKCTVCCDTGMRPTRKFGPMHIDEESDYIECECCRSQASKVV